MCDPQIVYSLSDLYVHFMCACKFLRDTGYIPNTEVVFIK